METGAGAGAGAGAGRVRVFLSEHHLLFGVDEKTKARLTSAGRELVDRLAVETVLQAEDQELHRAFELLDYAIYHVDCGHIVEVGTGKLARLRGKLRVRGVPSQPQIWGGELPLPTSRADFDALPIIVSSAVTGFEFGGLSSADDGAVRVNCDFSGIDVAYQLGSAPLPAYAALGLAARRRAKVLGFMMGWLEDDVNTEKNEKDLLSAVDASAATKGYFASGFDYNAQQWAKKPTMGEQGDDVEKEDDLPFETSDVVDDAAFLIANLEYLESLGAVTGAGAPITTHSALAGIRALAGRKKIVAKKDKTTAQSTKAQHKQDMRAVATPLVASIMDSLFSVQMGCNAESPPALTAAAETAAAETAAAMATAPSAAKKAKAKDGGAITSGGGASPEVGAKAVAKAGAKVQVNGMSKAVSSAKSTTTKGKRLRAADADADADEEEEENSAVEEDDVSDSAIAVAAAPPRRRAATRAIPMNPRSGCSSAVVLGDELAAALYGPGAGLPPIDVSFQEPHVTWQDFSIVEPPSDYGETMRSSGDFVTVFPVRDPLTLREYHNCVLVGGTVGAGAGAGAGAVGGFTFRVGDSVRVSRAAAAAATAGDVNPHAHLPRVAALSSDRGEAGATLSDVLRCVTDEAGAGVGLAHGAAGLPLPSLVFASQQTLRDGHFEQLAAEDADAAWYRKIYLARTKEGQVDAVQTLIALRGGGEEAFSYMDQRREDEDEIVRVSAIFTDSVTGRSWIHGVRLMPEILTTLGEVAHPRALVRVDECAMLPFAVIKGVVVVHDTDPRSFYFRTQVLPALLASAEAIDAVGAGTGADAGASAGVGNASGSVLRDQIAPEGGEAQWEFDWRKVGGLVPITTSALPGGGRELDDYTARAVTSRGTAVEAAAKATAFGGMPPFDSEVLFQADMWDNHNRTAVPDAAPDAAPAFFAHKHHNCVTAWTDIPRGEQAAWGSGHTLRRVRVLVPTGGALAHEGDVPAARLPWAGKSVAIPTGYTAVGVLHVWCPSCDAKRAAGSRAAPRPIGRGKPCDSGKALEYTALTQRGRLTTVGTAVYVNAVPGKENFAAADLSFHFQRPRAAWEQEGLIAQAKAERAERFTNEGDRYTELFRLNAGNPASARPIKAWDFTPPLQVLLVSGITAELDYEEATAAARPLVQLAGTPLYRPEDSPLPEADARSYHFQELFFSRRCEKEDGMDADLAFGVARVFRADVEALKAAQPALSAAAINKRLADTLHDLTVGHFDNVFFVRSAINHCAVAIATPAAPFKGSRSRRSQPEAMGEEIDDDGAGAGASAGAGGKRRPRVLKVGANAEVEPFTCPCAPEKGAFLVDLADAAKVTAAFDVTAIAGLLPLPLEPSAALSAGSAALAGFPFVHPQDVTRAPGAPLHGPSPFVRPPILSTMGHFAGAGGLDEGLLQSGAAETKVAVEFERPAAQTFIANHPLARVLCNDCNLLLDIRLHPWKAKGLAHAYFGAAGLNPVTPESLLLPPKGDTQLLVGGPPCQGFSGMNRFNVSDHSKAKNSHIVPYLSYLDYYRPRYFILENVPNVMQHPSSNPHLVVRMILRSVLEMGYQARVAVLQAGHHGVAQSRVRLIVLASAPGFKLPDYPAPVHTFEARRYAFSLNVAIGRWPVDPVTGEKAPREKSRPGVNVFAHPDWTTPSAPLRLVRTRDVYSDLPAVNNEGEAMAKDAADRYRRNPLTPFQVRMRGQGLLGPNATLTHHTPKRLTGLEWARAKLIPHWPGADWRDLPNEAVAFDGVKLPPIAYYGPDVRAKDFGMHEPRAVCACNTILSRKAADISAALRYHAKAVKDKVEKDKLDHSHYEMRSLIPWSLPHTGFRHNQWKGLYGRHCADGTTGTIVTGTQLIGKQGCWLHPSEDRIFSVREAARLQGFPDHYVFKGTVLDHYKQVGNAVPVPLGRALGWAIRAAYSKSHEAATTEL